MEIGDGQLTGVQLMRERHAGWLNPHRGTFRRLIGHFTKMFLARPDVAYDVLVRVFASYANARMRPQLLDAAHFDLYH